MSAPRPISPWIWLRERPWRRLSLAVVFDEPILVPVPELTYWRPAVPFAVEIHEAFTGRTFELPEPDHRVRGPRARCPDCGALYSTSAAADPHPCLTFDGQPWSVWEPSGRALERRKRPRADRGRPNNPPVLATAPVERHAKHKNGRRRCFVCRRPIGSKGTRIEPVPVRFEVRGPSGALEPRWAFRHPWCRGTIGRPGVAQGRREGKQCALSL